MSMPVKIVTHITGALTAKQQGVARLLASGAASWQGGKPAGTNICLNPHGTTVSAMVVDDRG